MFSVVATESKSLSLDGVMQALITHTHAVAMYGKESLLHSYFRSFRTTNIRQHHVRAQYSRDKADRFKAVENSGVSMNQQKPSPAQPSPSHCF